MDIKNTELESLYGVVTKVTYFSEETHFGVVRIKLDYQDRSILKYKAKLFSNMLTVTCNFDRAPLVDEEYDFVGEFITNQYGTQFKAKSYSRRNENTLEGVIAYLSSDLFPGIGKVSATKIYNTLGEDTIKLIEANKDVLDQVEGLSSKQKEVIYENLSEHQNNKKIILGLLDLGITMKTSLKLYKIIGEDVVERIRSNPYQLMYFVDGFGFKRADKIALEVGIKEDSDIRIKALLQYLINFYARSTGNVYIEYNTLFEEAMKEVNGNFDILNKEKFDRNLKFLQVEKQIFIENNDIYDFRIYNSENLLALKVKEFLNQKIEIGYNNSDIDFILKKLQEEFSIEYNQKQEQAIKTALLENIVIITGGPGTGKSTIIKAIIEAISRLYPNEAIKEKIALLAPTGRAAKRLKEVTNHQGQTIHKFLGYEGDGRFKYGYGDYCDAKIVIIDEFSMVDLALAARLFSALESDTKIILVGDVDQLPSVAPGEVLSDFISSKEITTIRLDKIHRQAEDSTIISLAHNLNQGFIPENILEKKHDRNFLNMQDKDIIGSIVKVVDQAIKSGMDLIRDIQVLVPMYKGDVGINAINLKLQEVFNPKTGQEIKHASRIFRVNDKVIQLVNRSEKKVMNGDIGYILNFNYDGEEIIGLSVMYDFGSVDYEKDELDDLTHAYAISIHKSQGSEFDLVILPFSFKYYIMLKRKLIYTAVTRAKKFLIMVGSIEALNKGVKGIEEKRKTHLARKISTNISDIEEFDLTNIDQLENVSPYDFLD
ncbi:MAG: ATP-dependent RecD-like DNA helicase [Bacilli bacterium]